ncbi:MAG: dephospho-CoA kinase [Chthoniobacterales bacterium]
MPSIAITGGIATGKSVATKFLAEHLNVSAFDADLEVSHLLDYDPEVAQEMITTFGPAIYDGQKKANRVCLRAYLIENPHNKKKLEEILHPRLRRQWLPQAQQAKGKAQPLFLAELPLLYENSLEGYFDHVIVVAASEQIQWQRLVTQRQLSSKVASALLQLQWPLLEKVTRATQLIWNDGKILIFHEQLKMAMTSICTRSANGHS